LLADPWRHGGRGALGRGRIEGTEDLGVACRALQHLRADVDLTPGAILRGAPAILALLVSNLVRRATLAGAGSDHAATDRLEEVGVADLGAAFVGDHHARLPPQRIDLRRQLEAHHARA